MKNQSRIIVFSVLFILVCGVAAYVLRQNIDTRGKAGRASDGFLETYSRCQEIVARKMATAVHGTLAGKKALVLLPAPGTVEWTSDALANYEIFKSVVGNSLVVCEKRVVLAQRDKKSPMGDGGGPIDYFLSGKNIEDAVKGSDAEVVISFIGLPSLADGQELIRPLGKKIVVAYGPWSGIGPLVENGVVLLAIVDTNKVKYDRLVMNVDADAVFAQRWRLVTPATLEEVRKQGINVDK